MILRASLLAAVLGSALSASAVNIGLISKGTLDASSVPTAFLNETVLLQEGGYGALSNLTAQLTDIGGFPLAGSGMYTGAGGELDFTYSVASIVFNNGYGSANGTWTATGGTGTYQNAVGGGTLAIVYQLLPSGVEPSYTTFRGNITAVPEPASMAVLGLGALGLLRRRKN